ncbi:FAD-binding oxidoreductase, partial [Pseudomonas chlororaphis]|uniref:FAD-binding oxidoreductase n=1 Tax=Pseudomonas chlororaphis TaxID=587753 RepID=UPI001FF0DAB7
MSKFHSLTIKDVRSETRDAVSIAFEIPEHLQDSFHFTQGQHLVMRTQLDGEEVRRSYSICAGVNDGELRIAVKRVAGGRFWAFATDRPKPGHCLDVMPPAGHFH